jgi:Xaa-Pro aminopeptidase
MSHAPTASLRQRHDRVRQTLEARSLDALVVTSLANVRYLTNFTGSSAVVVLDRDRCRFVTDFRYVTALEESRGTPSACPDLSVTIATGAIDTALSDLLAGLGAARVGFEAAHLTVARHTWLMAAMAARPEAASPALIPTEGLVESIRVKKDSYEVATFREAGRLLSETTRRILSELRAGMRERDVAALVDQRLREAGFEKPAFDTIVASGPNAALPHAHPGERRLGEGDLVVLDFGGVYDSYCVDLTRTVAVGRAGTRARGVYAAVLEAHDRAIAAVRPGQSPFDIDKAARDVLEARGLGEAFGHGTGHGLGLEIHEDPKVTRRRSETPAVDTVIAPGMVFTIEPGAYIPGWGGVRIEDDVLVTEEGVEVLTDVSTELMEVGS